MRLIDADELLKGKEDHQMISTHLIWNAPAVDAIQVVRCKDCKWWHREIYNGVEYFNFSSCDLNHYGDGLSFYCADAERKE